MGIFLFVKKLGNEFLIRQMEERYFSFQYSNSMAFVDTNCRLDGQYQQMLLVVKQNKKYCSSKMRIVLETISPTRHFTTESKVKSGPKS